MNFNKQVDEYNNTYNHSIGNHSSALTEKNESSHKTPKFKMGDGVRIAKCKNIFSKGTRIIGQEKYLFLILCWKLILGCLKLKI